MITLNRIPARCRWFKGEGEYFFFFSVSSGEQRLSQFRYCEDEPGMFFEVQERLVLGHAKELLPEAGWKGSGGEGHCGTGSHFSHLRSCHQTSGMGQWLLGNWTVLVNLCPH